MVAAHKPPKDMLEASGIMDRPSGLPIRGGELLVQQLGVLYEHLTGEFPAFGDFVRRQFLGKFGGNFFGIRIAISRSNNPPRITGYKISCHS